MFKNDIYLADLTHFGSVVASNVSPLGIGLLASYLKKSGMDKVNIDLYKYPHELNSALCKHIPALIGFANYSWNCDLAYQFATQIKKVAPKSVIVFGGPNYGLTKPEIDKFWKRYPLIDFYIVGEGEVAFRELYKKLEKVDFNIDAVKHSVVPLFNCHYLRDDKIIVEDLLPRIEDLDEIGSPYLLGLMDKFFDNVFIPMIHTTRGCPFTCTYCTEGNSYYSKVVRRKDIVEELAYIAERRGEIEDLIITDANFGMYKEDIVKAECIAKIQKKYNWPKRIYVSTGKNSKERVINVAKLVDGAINITASVQSTDKNVLENIKRSNISNDDLYEIVKKGTNAHSSTYSEIILGLPGDTLEKHTKSISDVINIGSSNLRIYQLILLPQTDLNTPESRHKYGIVSKFRINPRSLGQYNVLGEEIVSIEAEEICVANNTLSFTDYLKCRELDLSIEIIHNSGIFIELQGLCNWLNYPWFDFLLAYHKECRTSLNIIAKLYDDFIADNKAGLWESYDDLNHDVSINIENYIGNTEGTNEISKYKAKAVFYHLIELHDLLYEKMEDLLISKGFSDKIFSDYLFEQKEFSILRKKDFITTSLSFNRKFHFEFGKIQEQNYAINPEEYFLGEGIHYNICHNKKQIKMINSYITQYGKTLDGLGRILMRTSTNKLFRDFVVKS